MGVRRNSIIISGIIAAFILGSVSSVTLIEGSPASDAALVAALNEIRDAILGITPTQTVTVQSLEGPEGPPGADGPGLSCENQIAIRNIVPGFVADLECTATLCDPNGDGEITPVELQLVLESQFSGVPTTAGSAGVSAPDDPKFGIGNGNGVIDTPEELEFMHTNLTDFLGLTLDPECTIIF